MTSRVLLTGFGPFGVHAENPSETVVRRLERRPPEGLDLRTIVLPVSYGRAFGLLQAEVDRCDMGTVLMTGVATGRSTLEAERFALNWRGAATVDADGVRLDGEPIDPEGPAAYLATVPVDDVVAACASAGVDARASSHAGTFLCNQVLYQVLRHLDREGRRVRAGFLHLPDPREPEGAPLEALTLAIAEAVRLVASLPEADAARSRRTRATPARLVRPTEGRE